MSSGLNYYVLDLETTGLQSGYQEVVEISIIRACDRVQFTRNIRAQYPERASLDALEITGKTLSDLMIGKTHVEVIKEVNQFFELDKGSPASRCIVGHNIVAFDTKFLHAMWAQEGQAFPAHLFLDTLTMTKHFLKTHTLDESKLPKTARGKVSTRLHAALQITGAKQITQQAHTAKSDTRNTFMLWKKLVEDHQMDYLPHVKNIPHYIKGSSEDEDISDLEFSEIE